MVKNWKNRLTFFIKPFTHLAAVITLLLFSSFNDKPYLVSLMLIILFASYFRQFFLVVYDKPAGYKWISTFVELSAIIGISFIDKTGVGILFFFACLSETILFYETRFAGIFLVIPFFISRFFLNIFILGTSDATELLVDVFLMMGVPVAFVYGMSYYLKLQISEKEKLARINKELETAYKNLIDASTASEQLSIEKERVRMAREIHDTLAHTLTTLIVQLEACKKLAAVDVNRLTHELEKAQELTRSGLTDVKRTIKSLRPQALEGKTFFEWVLDFVNNTMNNTEVHIILNNHLPRELKLSTALEVTVFRLIQESVTNSIRHGQAKEVDITMSLNNKSIQITIKDNGIGCPRIKKGFGLSGIQERIGAAGGWVDFSSAVGQGFGTRVSIPAEELNL